MHWNVELAGAVATVSYFNPPENRVPFIELEHLDDILERISSNDDIKFVVIRSALEDHFFMGADLNDVHAMRRGDRPSAPFDNWRTVLLRIEEIRQPTVAFVDGLAASGGVEISLACTFRVGTSKAAFELREVPNAGIPAGGGTQRLPRTVGLALAADIIMSGRVVGAEEALQCGLLQAILPDGDQALESWLERYTRMDAAALFAAKRSLMNSIRLPYTEAMRLEQDMYRTLIRAS